MHIGQVDLLLSAASSGRACRCQGGLPIASITSLLPDGMGGSGRGYTGGGDGGGRGGGGGGGEDGFGFQSTTQPQQAGEQPDTESAPAASLPEDVIILEVGVTLLCLLVVVQPSSSFHSKPRDSPAFVTKS